MTEGAPKPDDHAQHFLDLTRRALAGDPEAIKILKEMKEAKSKMPLSEKYGGGNVGLPARMGHPEPEERK